MPHYVHEEPLLLEKGSKCFVESWMVSQFLCEQGFDQGLLQCYIG